MGEKKEPVKKARELFGKVSNLQQFQHKYGELFESLTEREVEVLTLVANGLNSTITANNLKISRKDVQDHRFNISKKLLINSQADYLKYALAFGLISF